MKSTKEIADMIGLSKMTVYRYIKANNIIETSQTDELCYMMIHLKSLSLKDY